MRNTMLVLAGCAAFLCVGAFVFAAITLLDEGQPSQVAPSVDLGSEKPDAVVPVQQDRPSTAEDVLRQDLALATTGEERIAALDRYATRSDATSRSRVLLAQMIIDDNPRTRLKAFRVAQKLAAAEGRDALISILTEGVSNPYPEVRRESIRACRDNPTYELMDNLIEVVDRGGAERSVAVQALAFVDDPQAQQKVLEAARSEDVPRSERIQAIALLSRTTLSEGVNYLQELATGDDRELQAFAMEALRTWQDRMATR